MSSDQGNRSGIYLSLDLPAYALKRLLNHKMNNDVTAAYIMKDVERLRETYATSS
ncbi:TPA: hypothetical protein KKW55_000779 [Legionella pneumophila]|nr:hypothetical protein [Legionella pneumophila]WII17058.1 hypothetical protein PT257_12055 [Legionella pneumophila]HAT1728932.1 hypothetical protein [Legionella pneumophila]HAT1795214.1 hypothetical protein [Legionella pneumophila]HAT1848486.1 hypothetical protein [Legionella pneumophila]HAT1903820.1 hypothetical protein [Legionella pneumophila]